MPRPVALMLLHFLEVRPGGAVVGDSIAFVEGGLVGDGALDCTTGLGVIGDSDFYG
jgi:hypothetical protein